MDTNFDSFGLFQIKFFSMALQYLLQNLFLVFINSFLVCFFSPQFLFPCLKKIHVSFLNALSIFLFSSFACFFAWLFAFIYEMAPRNLCKTFFGNMVSLQKNKKNKLTLCLISLLVLMT